MLPREDNCFFELSSFCVSGEVQIGDLFTILTIFIALIGALISVSRFNKNFKIAIANQKIEIENQKNAHYSELDRYYAEILKTAIEHPKLRTPRPLASDDDVLRADYIALDSADQDNSARYEAYAYMVWNFLETIHDRCLEDAELKKTWQPVLDAENAIHRGWFLNEMRRESFKPEADRAYKFCDGFRIFIYERQWRSEDDAFTDWEYKDDFKIEPQFKR